MRKKNLSFEIVFKAFLEDLFKSFDHEVKSDKTKEKNESIVKRNLVLIKRLEEIGKKLKKPHPALPEKEYLALLGEHEDIGTSLKEVQAFYREMCLRLLEGFEIISKGFKDAHDFVWNAVPDKEREQYFLLLKKVEQLKEEKIKRKPHLNNDLNAIKKSFQALIKDKKVCEHIMKAFYDCGFPAISIGGNNSNWRVDLLLKNKKLRKFIESINNFEEKHGMEFILMYSKKKGIELQDKIYTKLMPITWGNGKNYINKEGVDFLPSFSGKNIFDYYFGLRRIFAGDIDMFIPKIKISDTSNTTNLLKNLSLKLNKYFPTVITYESPNASKTFLLSIPQNCSLKEMNQYFSKSITKMHSMFYGQQKGRPQTKQNKQTIFNKEFSELREKKKKVSVERACQMIAEKYQDEFNGISWSTLKRHYYPVWKKNRQKQ